MNRNLSLRIFLPFFFLALTGNLWAASHSPPANTSRVHYVAAGDKLSIHAEATSLRSLLAQIALQSGIEVTMSPRAERNVSVDFSDQPLATGLKRLIRSAGVNHVLLYGENADNKPLVLALKILPKGESSTADLIPVVPHDVEVATHSKNQASPGGTPSIHDLVRQRWAERTKTMTPGQKQKFKVQMEQQEKRQLARAEKERERDSKKEERIAERKARHSENNQPKSPQPQPAGG